MVASFTLPDASFDDYHMMSVNPEGDRALIHTTQRKDDKRYATGAPGYAWILDTSNLKVRRHVDMRDHYPPDGQWRYVITPVSMQPGGDGLVFSSYASTDSESHHYMLEPEVAPAEQPAQYTLVYAKNGRTKATSETPAKSFASIRIFDTATGEDREALSIGRLAPPRMVARSDTLEVHTSPKGRWIVVLAQEEVKKYLSGFVAVVPS